MQKLRKYPKYDNEKSEVVMKSNRIPVRAFRADDGFIGRVQKLVREEVLPYQYQILNDAIPDVEKSHAIEISVWLQKNCGAAM